MQSTATIMKDLINRMLYVTDAPCPECNGQMWAWRTPKYKKVDGELVEDGVRCPPVCMDCGHKSLNKRESIKTEKMYNDSLKAKAINMLIYQSQISNKAMLDNKMNNYLTDTKETLEAKQMAQRVSDRIVSGEIVHAFYTGQTGTGKSHLAMATLWDVLEKSNYNKKCIFINYKELLDQMKFSMNDRVMNKRIFGEVLADIKTADVVVIDDLGAELGKIGEEDDNVKWFNLDTLYGIAEARQHQNLIVTTNLSSKQITELYDDRIASRLFSNSSRDSMFKFSETKDKRVDIR